MYGNAISLCYDTDGVTCSSDVSSFLLFLLFYVFDSVKSTEYQMDKDIEIIVKGQGSDISCDFYEPIDIPIEEYDAKIGVKNFSTFNNIPNIVAEKNNKLKIRIPESMTWEVFSLPTGAYELSVIAEHIVEWIEIKYPDLPDVEGKFKLIGNDATSKAEFIFKDNYGVDFDVDSSMCELLGFSRNVKCEGKGIHSGDNIVDITTVSQLVFNCNITSSNYINGKEMPFLYNCTVDVPAGYRLTRELTDISYKRLTTSQISHIRVWIVDQDGSPVNLRKDELTITLSLKYTRRVPLVSIASSTSTSQ